MNEAKYLVLNGMAYSYTRRVPKNLRHLDSRAYIKISLNTKDFAVAVSRLDKVNKETEKYFATLGTSQSAPAALTQFEQAVKRAQYFGLVYKDVADLSKEPLDDIQKRLELADKHLKNPAAIEAILGGAAKPKVILSNCLDTYFAIEKSKLTEKSKDQIRRWRNPRMKAIKNFVHIIGDKPIEHISRDEALSFRDYWLLRMQEENLTANSANKDLGHLQKILRVVSEHFRLDHTPVFSGLRFPEQQKTPRLPFSSKFILQNLIPKKALPGLSDAGKALILLMADTGARPSELISADDDDLHLDNAVPYIHIRNNKFRSLKTRNSEREVPLIGFALRAAKSGAFELFKPYRVNNLNLSGLVGKYFRDHGTLPSEQYTLYSLRHSFSDRMVAQDVPDRMQDFLMGHKFDKPSYGLGPALVKRLEWLEKIALHK